MGRDVYRSALQLIEEEGEEAVEAARLVARLMRAQGNAESAAAWDDILDAVVAVQRGSAH